MPAPRPTALPILLCCAISIACCGESDGEPKIVTRVETRLPPDPVGFPTSAAPPPALPRIATVGDWERATLALIEWGRENAARVEGWRRWWGCQKALTEGRACAEIAPVPANGS